MASSTTLHPRASSSLPRRSRPRPNLLKCAPVYFLCVISMLISLFGSLAGASPVPISQRDLDDDILGDAQDGPYNVTIQAGIAGAILIVLGFILCFFGYRIYHVTLFIVGFYFLGNLTYIGMVNAGITSNTLLLVVSIAVGVVGGLLLICCSRLGVAILGALAFFALGLWILGWKSGGVITSNTGRIVLLVGLVVLGFIIGLFKEREMVIIGSAIVGAYSFVIGIDMYAHTGFSNQADSFINSKNTVESHFEDQSVGAYILLGAFVVMAALGMIIQSWMYGKRTFRPATVVTPANDVVYSEKPSRFGGFFRRRF
ncbi:hypothetical protein BGX27_003398 [Mortierella sp. AM989]|nr:hypothetical protein BGX27_003398 [Mortierella sp. AM989]